MDMSSAISALKSLVESAGAIARCLSWAAVSAAIGWVGAKIGVCTATSVCAGAGAMVGDLLVVAAREAWQQPWRTGTNSSATKTETTKQQLQNYRTRS